jgi:hypothetical protein
MGDRSTLVEPPATTAPRVPVALRPPAQTAPPEAPPPTDAILCDQAVFTSIPSPMGEGYRLIAASPGVRPDEKVEITQRSPSHDSLCDPGPLSVGLLSYTLASGRYCVAYCGHAGREHTARGGRRVYTHMALLTPAEFAAFQNNPVRVHALLAELISRNGPMLKPAPRTEKVALPVAKPTWGHGCAGFLPPVSAAEADWIWALADALQNGRRLVLAGTHEPLRLLEWAVLCLKYRARHRIDASAGLKYAPGRKMQLVLLPKDDPQMQRLIAGQDVLFRQTHQPAPPPAPAFLPWANLLRTWYANREVTGPT